jgi:hypothetical protein
MSHAVAPGTAIAFRVPGTKIRRTGSVVFSHAVETPMGVRFAVGVQREGKRPGALRVERVRVPAIVQRTGTGVAAGIWLAASAPALSTHASPVRHPMTCEAASGRDMLHMSLWDLHLHSAVETCEWPGAN